MRNKIAGWALAVGLALAPVSIGYFALAPAVHARGGGGFSGGGGGRSSGSSSSSKSFSSGGGSKSAGSSSGGSKSFSASKPPTVSKPATFGQRAPVAKAVPAKPVTSLGSIKAGSPPPRVSIPSGRNYSADAKKVSTGSYVSGGNHYYYYDAFGPSYYGSYGSPYYYLWLGSIMDNDPSNNGAPPQANGQVSDALESYLGVVQQEAQFMADKGVK